MKVLQSSALRVGIGVSAIVALLIGGGYITQQEADESTIVSHPSLERVGPDGGAEYYISTYIYKPDGAVEHVDLVLPEADCVKKVDPAHDCMRRIQGMGGPVTYDPGAGTVFDKEEAVGTECAPSACSVLSE